jgi:hypothetical protein
VDQPVRCLVYQVFDLDDEKKEMYTSDLKRLRDVLGRTKPQHSAGQVRIGVLTGLQPLD